MHKKKKNAYIPLLETNKVWVNVYEMYKGGDHHFEHYEITDTLNYNDSLLHKIVYNETTYLREDTVERKVYYRHSLDKTEYLIYDFSMEVGNSINGIFGNDCVLYLDSIKDIEYLGKERKTYYFHSNTGTQPVWVEGIGSLAGILEPLKTPSSPGLFELNCCYSDNEQFYKSEMAIAYGCSYDSDNVSPILESIVDNRDTVSVNDKVSIYLIANDLNYVTPSITLTSPNGNEISFSDFTYHQEATCVSEQYYYEAIFNDFNGEIGNWYVSHIHLEDTFNNVTEKSYTSENSPVKFYVKRTIGMNDQANKEDCYIYPNPVNDNLYVSLSNFYNKEYTIEISDLSGRILYKQNATSKTTQIDISTYKSGVYICKIYNNEKIQTKKIIIQ